MLKSQYSLSTDPLPGAGHIFISTNSMFLMEIFFPLSIKQIINYTVSKLMLFEIGKEFIKSLLREV